MDEIKTFGNLLSFCINLEGRMQDFYLGLVKDKENKILIERFLKLADQNRKRKLLLERIRRENVNEMILQPIEGLKPDIDFNQLTAEGNFKPLDILERSIKFEKIFSQFYLDAASKANLILAEASRYFKKLAKENYLRISELKILYDELGV